MEDNSVVNYLLYDEQEVEVGGTFIEWDEGIWLYRFPAPWDQGEDSRIYHAKIELNADEYSVPCFFDVNDTDASGLNRTYKTLEWLTDQTEFALSELGVGDFDDVDVIELPYYRVYDQTIGHIDPSSGSFTCATSTGNIDDQTGYSYYIDRTVNDQLIYKRKIESTIPYKAVYSTNTTVYLSSWYEAQNGFPACAQQCTEVKTVTNSWDVYSWVDYYSGTDERDGAIDEQNTGNVSFSADEATSDEMPRTYDPETSVVRANWHALHIKNLSTVLANPFDASCPVPDGVTDRGLVYSEIDYSATTVFTVTVEFIYDF